MLLYVVDYVCIVMCHAVWSGEQNVHFLQENVKLNEFEKVTVDVQFDSPRYNYREY
jgi:hypothetical protein